MDFGNIYNSLGLRVGKTDSTGTLSYVCDGTTPGSPVLIDGHTLYTPGLSENRGGTSVYYDFDRLGNLWTADGTGKSQYAAVDYSAFGITLAGSAGTPFGYGGANGCQTDLDASLVLMGHRYYDPRTGRFLTQDPAGSGNNWYAYAGNNPVNKTDPSGLMPQMSLPEGSSPQNSPGYMGMNTMAEVENAMEILAYNALIDQVVDENHKAWDHYLGKTGKPMSINVNDLNSPSVNILDTPAVQQKVKSDPGHQGDTYHIDTNVDLNFRDALIGRAEGHFIGTLTMLGGNGNYSVDGKLYVYPDTYKFNNDPNRGPFANGLTNATRNLGNVLGGGKDFTINVNGYIPMHQQSGG